MTTLVTFIGKGEAATNASADPYQRTTYQFADGRSLTSTFFGEALSQHQQPTVIHVFGTRTSSWRALAWDSLQDIELATRLEAVEKTGVTDDLVAELARALSTTWGSAVTCRCISEDNHLDTVALIYRSLSITDQNLLDLTHGYRFMPMLALAAVQICDAFHPGVLSRTAYWYGKLIQSAARPAQAARPGDILATGTANHLTDLARALSLAQAAATFARSLDPEPLLAALGQIPKPLRLAFDALGDALLTHQFSVLTTAPQQIISHLGKWDGDPGGMLAEEVRRVLEPLSRGSLGQRLIALATWAHARQHHALAALAAYEGLVCIATKDVCTDGADHAISALLSGKDQRMKETCDRLRLARNRVAHGAERVQQGTVKVAEAVRNALPVLKALAG